MVMISRNAARERRPARRRALRITECCYRKARVARPFERLEESTRALLFQRPRHVTAADAPLDDEGAKKTSHYLSYGPILVSDVSYRSHGSSSGLQRLYPTGPTALARQIGVASRSVGAPTHVLADTGYPQTKMRHLAVTATAECGDRNPRTQII